MENVPTNNVKMEITTKSLGIAEAKARDISGIIISQKEINTAVTKIITMLGVPEDAIRGVKVGSDAESRLHIITEIKLKALSPKKRKTSWCEFSDGDGGENKKESFFPEFYSSLHNKFYHGKRKHLNWKKVYRDNEAYASIEIDPYIFIAFVYNIVFTDRLYKISAPQTRWMSNKELDQMTGKQKKRYRSEQEEYRKDGIAPCIIYVTFGANAFWNGARGNRVTGFHPEQVDEFYSDEDEAEKYHD